MAAYLIPLAALGAAGLSEGLQEVSPDLTHLESENTGPRGGPHLGVLAKKFKDYHRIAYFLFSKYKYQKEITNKPLSILTVVS